MIFIDASAFVSVLASENDALALAACLDGETAVICSAISVWETVAALCNNYRYSNEDPRKSVSDLMRDLKIRYADIGQRETELAISAYAQFGKGRHQAALNMGDCFAYACAKANSAKLLFKGQDFSKTDIEVA